MNSRYTRGNKKVQKFSDGMQKKLLVLYMMILVAFVYLSFQVYLITRDNGDEYKKQILSQQEYDSTTIPFKRGDILDANGMVLASSNKVYNIILDAKMVASDEKYMEPTLNALHQAFGMNTSEIRTYIQEHPNSQYYVLAKKQSYDVISVFKEMQNNAEDETSKYIKGVWFEDEYERQYPNGSLASHVIGFTTGDNAGTYGLEAYYNSVLSGRNGRVYGYLNEDATLERTTIAATDGYTIVSTIDSNIQAIAEKYLKDFNEQYKNNYHEGNGAENVGCIIMDVHSGNVLAMASYPNFDLNDPRNTNALLGARQVDAKGNKTTGEEYEVEVDLTDGTYPSDMIDSEVQLEEQEDASAETESEEIQEGTLEENASEHKMTITRVDSKYVNEESLALMDNDTMYQNLNSLWKNFCINDTYEPGSVAKPFSVAAALDTGSITGNEGYNCEGFLHVGDYDIKCHNIYGDGFLSVAEAVERSCNVGLMHIAFATGIEKFSRYQHIFGFGLKTNVDLAGESRTASLLKDAKAMNLTDLATYSFGQGYNVTMIEMISGFCSLINGGNYYEPHLVSKILTSDGATIENIEPRLLKQTISKSTSDKIIQYCNQVVTGEHGTGKTARPAGYMIGGKTGTAQTLPRGNRQYVVSFMGYAPADDPQIAIYVVVDRPNVPAQDDAKYATRIVRNILTEVLPYMHIYMTEELSEKEKQELEEKNLEDTTQAALALQQQQGMKPVLDEEGNPIEQTDEGITESQEVESEQPAQEEAKPALEPWKSFPIDSTTGYAVDPNTGAWIDPTTGATVKGGDSDLPDVGLNLNGNSSAFGIGDEPDQN